MSVQKLVVFDLDGTLNQTDLFSVPAHLKALSEYGITHITREQIIATYGSRAQDYVRVLLPDPDEETARNYLSKVAAYEKELIAEKGAPFPGVVETLTWLRENGYHTAVCSNASARYINLVLTSLHLDGWIDDIQQLYPDMTKADTLKMLLERLRPEKAVMVGDRYYDMEAARANGIPFIGCLYGYCPAEVKAADRAVANAFEIAPAVQELLA